MAAAAQSDYHKYNGFAIFAMALMSTAKLVEREVHQRESDRRAIDRAYDFLPAGSHRIAII